MEINEKKLKLLVKQLSDLVLESEDSGDEPETQDIAASLPGMALKDMQELAEKWGVSSEDLPRSELRALLITASKVKEGDGDTCDDDDLKTLMGAVGLPTKKFDPDKAVESLGEFFDTEDDKEEEDEKDSDDEESDDEDLDEDDEKPKKAKKSSDDEDDENKDSDDEDSDEDEDKPKKVKKSSDDEDDEEEDSDEEEKDEEDKEDEDEDEDDEPKKSVKLTDKHVALYNKKAKKQVSSVKELQKLLKGDDEEPVPWGKAYVKGDIVYCCGLPLLDAKVGKNEGGKCRITGKFFYQDENGELTEGK